ncbi:MAG: hypothetical protein HYW95_00500 [Candidatus Wildermuthbacteria bacterium]|nr:hypothetical protein [Candidatus Wildermuthbacteria bacterium]
MLCIAAGLALFFNVLAAQPSPQPQDASGQLQKMNESVVRIWQQKIAPFMFGVASWIQKQMDIYVFSWGKKIWQGIKTFVLNLFESKRPALEEELQKEKQEVQHDLQTQTFKQSKNIFEKFISLFNTKEPQQK